jgi:hypothetical protein
MIEMAILQKLHQLLGDQLIGVERMREIAVYTLEKMPVDISSENLFKVLGGYMSDYPEVASVVTNFLQEYEVRSQKKTHEMMKHDILQQNYDAAIDHALVAANYQL